jgi:hypothetical protein
MPDINVREADVEALSDAELKQILGRVMLEMNRDAAPLIDEDELQQRTADERELIKEAANKLALSDSEPLAAANTATAKRFLVEVSMMSPENARIVREAISEAKSAAPKLDLGVGFFALNVLVIAIAGAVLRPSINYESEIGKDGSGKRKFSLKLQGVKNIENVIKTVLPFTKVDKLQNT